MPRLTIPLMESYKSITRRVATSMTKFLLEQLMLPDDTTLLYKGESTQMTTWNSELQQFDKVGEGNPVRFSSRDRLEFEIKEEETEEGRLKGNFTHDDYPPIWYDPNHNLSIRPNYIQNKLTISYIYHSETRERADRFRAELHRLFEGGRLTLPMAIDYYIHPHHVVFSIVKHVYDLQENNDGYGISYKDWLTKNAKDNSLRHVKKLDGTHPVLGFKEVQTRVLGIFEMSEIPEKAKKDKDAGYDVSFDFYVYYDKPINTTVIYPIIVHNQMIDGSIIPGHLMDKATEKSGVTYNVFNRALNSVLKEMKMEQSFTNQKGIIVPLGDDWNVPAFHPAYQQAYQAACVIGEYEEDGYMQIMDHRTLTKHLFINQGATRWISNHPHLVTDYINRSSPMIFCLYRNDQLINPANLKMDRQMNIYTNFKFSQRDRLHLVVYIMKDFSIINPSFFPTIIRYPDFAEELICSYDRYPVSLNKVYEDLISKYECQLGMNPLSKSDYLKQGFRKHFLDKLPLSTRGAYTNIRIGLLLDIYDFQYHEAIVPYFHQWLKQAFKLTGSASLFWARMTDLDERDQYLRFFWVDLLEWLKERDKNPDETDVWLFGKVDYIRYRKSLAELRATDVPLSSYRPGDRIMLVAKAHVRTQSP